MDREVSPLASATSSPADSPVASLRGVSKTYRLQRGLLEVLRHPFAPPVEVVALHNLSLDLHRQQIHGLLGPNGAGKTTLIKILANLVSPDDGEVWINGFDIRTQSLEARRSVGYIGSDERSFFWRLSTMENLKFFATLYEVPPRIAQERIEAHLEYFGLTRVAARRFGLLSSGQKKIISIIRALVADPPIVILDEPTNSLDPPAAHKLMDYVRHELADERHRAILWATHRLEEVREVCERVTLLHQGEFKFSGTVREFVEIADSSREGLGGLRDVFERLVAQDQMDE